ncbi:MAG TPA: type I-C CRISPR-associated protein Cas8c/Csd1 [Candidatus Atribacteria bacterium]|nr:type I-C CRISPR-associated protein Cas8c/Csd1 [Candidatus Atribacteria bacterium]
MLGELLNYAKANNISDKPGFKTRGWRWLIVLSDDGKYIDVIDENCRYNMCPNLEQFELVGGETKSHFLLDSLGVAVKYKSDNKDIVKHGFFKKMLTEASSYEPALKACISFLSNDAELARLHEALAANRARRTEYATFKVGSLVVVKATSWHKWWLEYRKNINGPSEPQKSMICIASGEYVEPITNHFKISGLANVGGQPSGSALISFDKEAFTSYNLSQSLNAACSENVAAAYRNALDDLIDKAPRPIGDSVFLHWYKEPLSRADDIFELEDSWEESEDAIQETADNKVRRIFNSVVEGNRPELTDNIYYILQVSGAGGRVMVRDWLTGDFKELVINIKQWFDDISLIEQHGNHIARDFKLSAAMCRLVSYRPGEKTRDTFSRIKKELTPLEPVIWRSVIENRVLPDTVAAKALGYIVSKLHSSEDSTNENLDRIACSLLKAYINRKYREKGEGEIMKEELDTQNKSVEYLSGRLLAVLADIQQSALGDVNAGIVQRYYTAASSTPRLIIGRLIQLSQHHLDKISKDKKGLAIWYEKMLSEIMEQIDIDDIPLVVGLEGQTLFALGYYQQKAQLYKSKAESKENKEGDK